MIRRFMPFAVALACATTAFAADPGSKPGTPPVETEPRDPEGALAPPAAYQNEGTGRPGATKVDVALIRGIRDALRRDRGAPAIDELEVAAVDGKVVLRGSVRTQAEKDAVTAKTGAVAGLRNVTNNITLAP